MALKQILKNCEKVLQSSDKSYELPGLIEASTLAVAETSREKVIKVFNCSLQLFNMIVSSSRVDQEQSAMGALLDTVKSEDIIGKLLLKSEESNTRTTNKIHEALLDLSYHPKVGEDAVAERCLEIINLHNMAEKSNHKGLLAQLALMYKTINSFGLAGIANSNGTGATLTVARVLDHIVPNVGHTNSDVRNAATKILLDVQRLSGQVTE